MTMDCQHARQTLDASRPRRRDWSEPELRAAAAHATDCESCRILLAERERFDDALAKVLQDVEVPSGLQERLLAALAADRARVIPAPHVPPLHRRRWWRWAAVCASLCLLVFAGWWWAVSSPKPLSMEDVFATLSARALEWQITTATSTAVAPAGPHAFDGSFEVSLPDTVWRDAVGTSSAGGLDLDGRPGHEAACYRFAAGRVAGVLVILPRSRVLDPPSETVPRRNNSRYLPQPQVAWSVGEYVYVCVLERGTLEDLQHQFYGGAA